ncbi:MAG: right-handed parallel beta-helix repeat-containing protein, partial [Anaerolineales bacterium]|nr:right-handed parallel beta-helix repeat-containing protein [Anaerolineales bacterium]
EFEIFGQRVAADGSLLGSNFRISQMGTEDDPNYRAEHPAVAHNPDTNQYLVVWSGDDDAAPLVQGEKEIFGQLLDAGGVAVGGNFRVSDMGPDGSTLYGAYLPDVAYNPDHAEYLVVWMADDDTAPLVEGEFEVFAQRLTAAGAEVGRHNFQVSAMGTAGDGNYAAYRPRLVYNPQDARYMLVWRGGDNTGGQVSGEFEIFQQAIYGDAALGDHFRETTRLSAMGNLGDPAYLADKPVIAYSSTANNYLVAWQGENNLGSLIDGKVEIFSQQYAGAPLRCFVESNGDNVTDYSGSTAAVLQDAVNAASPGNTLKLAGDCTGVQSTGGGTQTLYIDKSLYLQGGYVAPDLTTANWLGAADAASYPTTLDAQGLGRVVYVTGTAVQVTIANVTLTGGRDSSSECAAYSCGGGLKVDAGADVTLTHSTVRDNTAYYGGGIFSYGTLQIVHSTIAHNVAESWDGGIYSSGSLTIENSTISGNTATSGNAGGLASVGTLTMRNSTIFGNTAAGDTGGFRQQSNAASVYNTIIANNSGLDCSLTDGGTLAANVHNLVEDGTCSAGGIGFLSGNPQLGSLADNGGDTLTHALLPNSPAIDAGEAASCLATDQRDLARDDLGCDLGAYEVRYADTDTVIKENSLGGLPYSFGPTWISMTLTAPDSGVITVTKRLTYPGGTPDEGEMLATWHISSTLTTGFPVTLAFCYTDEEVTGLNEAALRAFRWNGTSWVQQGDTAPVNRCVTVAGVNAFSAWTLFDTSAGATPTAVTLS